MNLFYASNLQEQQVELSVEESKHVRALRKRPGDEIALCDGKGSLAMGELLSSSNKKAWVRILDRKKKEKHPYYLHIAIAPTKSNDRFAMFLEKATELGIDEISPIFTSNSERKKLNLERCERVVLSAMKQSGRYYLPKINGPTSLGDFISSHLSKYNSMQVAYIGKDEALPGISGSSSGSHLVLIGPEGGWKQAEIDRLSKQGIAPVTLGNYRLRTETAGIMVCAAFG